MREINQIINFIKKNQSSQALTMLEDFDLNEIQNSQIANQLGIFAYENQKQELAYKIFKRGLFLNPDDLDCNNNLASILITLRRHEEAKSLLEKIIKMNPNFLNALFNLGICNEALMAFDKAWSVYKKILFTDPLNLSTHIRLALVAEKLHDKKNLQKHIQQAINIDPNHPEVLFLTSLLHQQEGNFPKALEAISQAIQIAPQNPDLYYKKASILEKLSRYDEAFENYTTGNQMKDLKLKTREDFLKTNIELIKVYKEILNQNLATQKPLNLNAPIFILGCVRSGTSLLAQMLDSHSKLNNEGELNMIHHIFQEALSISSFQGSLAEFIHHLWLDKPTDLIEKLQNRFQELVKELGSSKMGFWAIDKMPDNALAVAFIQIIAPGAPIIHMVRDGREVSMSSFRQNFGTYHWHSYNIEDGIYYWSAINQNVKAAAQCLKLNYHFLKYEDLISNPEKQLKSIFNFLNLDWEEQCLEFYKNNKIVKTASYQQVRKKLYQSGLDFCKRNYPNQFKKMSKIGSDALSFFGYKTF